MWTFNKCYGFLDKSSVFQYLALFTVTLNTLCAGLHVGWPTPSLPQLLDENYPITVTDDEGSWIASMLLIGGVVGSLTASVVLDKFGRKNCILFTSIPIFVSWIVIAFAKTTAAFLVGRFLGGLASGLIFCSAPVYLTEIADAKIRGFITCSITVVNVIGIFLSAVVGSYVSIQTTALLCLIFPVLLLLTFVWIPESPHYLLMKDKVKEARKSLEYFRRTKDVDEELTKISETLAEQNKSAGKYTDLLIVASNRKAVFLGLVLRIAQQFSGVAPIAMYFQIIFKSIDFVISPETATIIYFGVQLVTSLLCSLFVDKIGRRPLLITSLAGVVLSLFMVTCYFYLKDETTINVAQYGLIPVIALIMYVVTYGIGLFSIPLLVIGELFPTNVRAFAVSIADVIFCIASTLAIKLFQLLKDTYGLYVPICMFVVFCTLSLVYIIVYLPETKGKSLEEIQELLKAKPNISEDKGERVV